MREAFHDQLDSIFSDLAVVCGDVQNAVRLATEALLTGDAEKAEDVISADSHIDEATERVEDNCFSLLSLQQPVAGDLRVIVSALRMVSELERMGDLSVHVAKIARLRVPGVAVPEEIRPTVARMAEVSDDWAHGVEAAVDIALLGRYYERIADHAVSVGNRVVFVVTGQFPVASDA
jgi:phosphate transport system protein